MTDLYAVHQEIAQQFEEYSALTPDNIQKHFVLRQL
jgi:hypothetical protein